MIGRLLAVVALVLVTGCSADTNGEGDGGSAPTSTAESAASAEPAPTPEQPRPRVRQCRALGLKAAVAPTSAVEPRRCTKGHTAQTFHVGRLDLERGGRDLAVDSRAVQGRVATSCTGRLARHLRVPPRELRLSMARTVWFTPTVSDADAGANWYRCDVVVVAAPERLMLLPRRTAGLGGSSSIAMCGTSEPGTKAFSRVVCSRRHSWRAVSTVDLPGKRFPSPAAVSARMQPQCRAAARAQTSDPLDFTWSEERPTRQQWRAGQRYGICWVPTVG